MIKYVSVCVNATPRRDKYRFLQEVRLFSALKGWLTVFFLGLIVFMGCSQTCVHASFFKNALFFT